MTLHFQTNKFLTSFNTKFPINNKNTTKSTDQTGWLDKAGKEASNSIAKYEYKILPEVLRHNFIYYFYI